MSRICLKTQRKNMKKQQDWLYSRFLIFDVKVFCLQVFRITLELLKWKTNYQRSAVVPFLTTARWQLLIFVRKTGNELSAFSRGALFDNSSMTTPNIRSQNGKRTISVQPRCPFDHSVMITPEIRSQSSDVFYLARGQVERNFASTNCCKSKKL